MTDAVGGRSGRAHEWGGDPKRIRGELAAGDVSPQLKKLSLSQQLTCSPKTGAGQFCKMYYKVFSSLVFQLTLLCSIKCYSLTRVRK
jgi:hypothetical protein